MLAFATDGSRGRRISCHSVCLVVLRYCCLPTRTFDERNGWRHGVDQTTLRRAPKRMTLEGVILAFCVACEQ